MNATLTTWLEQLGYLDTPEALYSSSHLPTESAYATEIEALLSKDQDVSASAVFSVGDVPTICFVEAKIDSHVYSLIESIRRKIWNQSLVSLILVIDDDHALPVAATRSGTQVKKIRLQEATPNGPYSALDVISGDLESRVPDWFSKETRVDRDLLKNLSLAVLQLEKCGVRRQDAQYVLGRCLFISFLEHRGIVGNPYRERRGVQQLHALISSRDKQGLTRLLTQLKDDFNGDFLQPDESGPFDWTPFPDAVFSCLSDFLGMVDLESQQLSFWAYDFRYIPVELISGIYETFLDHSEKKLTGAYYTPRHLANFAVDQAFEGIVNICNEIVYDGACGSGILLATAYRRMVRAASINRGHSIGFQERCSLLVNHIRGSDIDETACRVSAFSLYLCLLENLEPVDITLLQDDVKVKLPPLINEILLYGAENGDFFSDKNRFAQPGTCTIYLSNPPWGEATGKQKHSFEIWAEKPPKKVIAHRNIAIGFAHKVAQVVRPGGRFCLIMNAKPFLSRSSQDFIQQWFSTIHVQRLINFSDIRRLLFPAAIHPCVLAIGITRTEEDVCSPQESFEYWTPKSDVSLAFGRLTIHGIDRHSLQTSTVKANNQRLRTYFWGGPHDHAFISRLCLSGVVSDLLAPETKGEAPRWIDGKGFHVRDGERKQDPSWLRNIPFYDADSKPKIPLLDSQLLEPFPETLDVVASFGAHQGQLFRGPRVIFNDGADGGFEPQAFFSNKDFSFKSSVGAFKGPDQDADLLRFFAVYLRSKLAKYVLLHTSYALATERTRVTMVEVGTLPFFLPENHRNPELAHKTIEHVAQSMIELEQEDSLSQPHLYAEMRDTFDSLIYDYFGLNSVERMLVEEATNKLIPSVQPASLSSIHKPTLARTTSVEIRDYVVVLQSELQRIQSQLNGRGSFAIEALVQSHAIGPIGIVRIGLSETNTTPTYGVQDDAVVSAIAWLKEKDLLPMPAGESFNLASDFLFFANDAIYLAKPLISRFWLATQALKDSRRIMDAIRLATSGDGEEA